MSAEFDRPPEDRDTFPHRSERPGNLGLCQLRENRQPASHVQQIDGARAGVHLPTPPKSDHTKGYAMQRSLRVLVSMSAVAMIVTVLVGCSAQNSPGSATSASTPSSTTTLRLSAKDSASTTSLAVGQKLQISLDSNPTTGYRWAVDGEVPPQLEQLGESKYTATAAAPGIVGSGGTELWTFEGKSAGKTTLKLKYWRSFEPTATPPSTFQITVDVR